MKLKFANLDFTPKTIDEAKYTLRAIFSTGDVDRQGEIVDQKSWKMDDYLKNPVLLFGHDHSQPPVGKIVGLGYNGDGNLEGDVKFAAEEYPFAKVIWGLYKGGYMKAFSVGFSAGKVDMVDGQPILKDNTLYEISTVSVPANAMALAKSKGLDVEALEEKMVEIAEEGEKHTKECTTPEAEVKGCPCREQSIAKMEAEGTKVDPEPPASDPHPVNEQKGAVADEVVAQDEIDMKYDRMRKISDITCALWSVYMKDETPLNAFSTLVAEASTLLQSAALDTGPAEAGYENALKNFIEQGIPQDSLKAFIASFKLEEKKPDEKQEEGKEEAVIKAMAEMTEALKENGKAPLTDAYKEAIRNGLKAFNEIMAQFTKEEVKSENNTDLDIKVVTPAVRISVPNRAPNKAKLINKAIRALLAAKRTIKKK